MAFKSARLDDDSLHKVMRGDQLVCIKGSVVIEDDALGSTRMRFSMEDHHLAEYIMAPNDAARKSLLRAYVQRQIAKSHDRLEAEPPPLHTEPLGSSSLGDNLKPVRNRNART